MVFGSYSVIRAFRITPPALNACAGQALLFYVVPAPLFANILYGKAALLLFSAAAFVTL